MNEKIYLTLLVICVFSITMLSANTAMANTTNNGELTTLQILTKVDALDDTKDQSVLLGINANTATANTTSNGGLTALQILTKVDALDDAKDQSALVEMILVDKGGKKDKKKMTIKMKDGNKRLIKFLAPADVKGIGFLVLNADTPQEKMYLYLPAFRKIRTIASHVKNQSFQGTDFSYEDIGFSEYAKKYTANLQESVSENIYLLELKPEKKTSDYSKLVMWVNKENFVPAKVEFYNKQNKLYKVMENSKVEQLGKYYAPTIIKMTDVIKKHSTTMHISELKYDSGLDKSLFTKRYLKR
jgi:outer membrane lipoprotein-sorting protein